MAFENGFDPNQHYRPITDLFEKTPQMPQTILGIIDNYIKSDSWPSSMESMFKEISNAMNDNWAYSCLRQYLLFDEAAAQAVWGQGIDELEEQHVSLRYRDFFLALRTHYIPSFQEAWKRKENQS